MYTKKDPLPKESCGWQNNRRLSWEFSGGWWEPDTQWADRKPL